MVCVAEEIKRAAERILQERLRNLLKIISSACHRGVQKEQMKKVLSICFSSLSFFILLLLFFRYVVVIMKNICMILAKKMQMGLF